MCFCFHESEFQNRCENERHYWQFDESGSHLHMAEKRDREESMKEVKTLLKKTRKQMKEQHKLGKKLKNKLIELKKESGEEGRKGSRERKRVTTEIIETFGKEKARGRGSKEARGKKKQRSKEGRAVQDRKSKD